MPLIVMVSPSTIRAVPEMSAVATLLRRNRKMKVGGVSSRSHVSLGTF